jgi:hypothetical protein
MTTYSNIAGQRDWPRRCESSKIEIFQSRGPVYCTPPLRGGVDHWAQPKWTGLESHFRVAASLAEVPQLTTSDLYTS